jgi:hypothetical protein
MVNKIDKSVIYHSYFEHLRKSNLKFENKIREVIIPKVKWSLSDFFDISEFTSPSMCLTEHKDGITQPYNIYHLTLPTNDIIDESYNLTYYFETQAVCFADDVWNDIKENITRFEKYINEITERILESQGIDNCVVKSIFYPSNIKQNRIIIFIIKKDQPIINVLETENKNIFKTLIKYNTALVNSLGGILNDKELYKLISSNPETFDILNPQNKLIKAKYDKDKTNPDRRKMERGSDMYVFVARPKFTEVGNGNYKKDLEIENMVKINPYNADDLKILNFVKLRARVQSNNSEVYCVWIQKGAISEEELQDINSEDSYFIRNAIDIRKEKI